MNIAKEAFEKYAVACYGDLNLLTELQRKKVEQAFISGIHWTLTEPLNDQLSKHVANRLREIGSFPSEWN